MKHAKHHRRDPKLTASARRTSLKANTFSGRGQTTRAGNERELELSLRALAAERKAAASYPEGSAMRGIHHANALGWVDAIKHIRQDMRNEGWEPSRDPMTAKRMTDGAVLNAFIDRRTGASKKLTSHGNRLDGNWMGGRGIAEWHGDKIVFHDLGSRAAQKYQRALRVITPKNWLTERDPAPRRRNFGKSRVTQTKLGRKRYAKPPAAGSFMAEVAERQRENLALGQPNFVIVGGKPANHYVNPAQAKKHHIAQPKSGAIHLAVIRAKDRTSHGKVYPGPVQEGHQALIVPGKSIQLFGGKPDYGSGSRSHDLTFRIGDFARYGGRNIDYIGTIVAIGPQTVSIAEPYNGGKKIHRHTIYDFDHYNAHFDHAASLKRNSEWMD